MLFVAYAYTSDEFKVPPHIQPFFFRMNEPTTTQFAKQTDPSPLGKFVLWREECQGMNEDWIGYCLANVRGYVCLGLCDGSTTRICFVCEGTKENSKERLSLV